MKTVSLILNILYITFCGIVTFILLPFLFLTLAGNIVSLKLIFYVFFMLVCFVGLWVVLFVKIKQIFKILIVLALIPITFYLFIFSNPYGAVNMSNCVDTGICKEGFKTKNENNSTIVINKENCIKNGFKWYEEDKSCNLRENIK